MRAPPARLVIPALVACAASACATSSGGRAAPAPGGAGSEPLAVARAFYGALHRGDARGAAGLVASPNGAPATSALVTLSGAYRSLEGAMRDRFGEGAAAAVGYSSRVEAEAAALAAAFAEVDGDRALVRSGGETLATLQRVGGAWRIVLEDALATDAGVASLVLEAEAARDAAARVAPAIRGGLFDAPEDALEAFKVEMSARMQRGEPDVPREPPGVEL